MRSCEFSQDIKLVLADVSSYITMGQGTPGYWAPEVLNFGSKDATLPNRMFRTDHDYNIPCDIFSLGVTLWNCYQEIIRGPVSPTTTSCAQE